MNLLIFQLSTTIDSWQNWSSWAIRHFSGGPFSHVDIDTGYGLLGASDSPNAPVIQGSPRGVAVRPYDYQAWGLRRQVIIQTDKADAVIAEAMTQLGKPFDHNAIKAFLSGEYRRPEAWRDTGMWFCAELAMWATELKYWSKRLVISKDHVKPTDIPLLFQFDPNWINRDTFMDPIPGLALGFQEH